jgi:hypothetical protein
LNAEQLKPLLLRRVPVQQRLVLAVTIFLAGAGFHAFIHIHAERPFDASILLRLPLIALPYAIQAVAASFTRTTLGAVLFATIALSFSIYDLCHIRAWSMAGPEAAIDIGLLWMGQLFLAILLSIATLIFTSR